MKKAFASTIVALCLLAGVPAISEALSPPVAEPGEVVFANAGRIISINADGSERTILTRKRAGVGTRDFLSDALGTGDENPRISPDGRSLAWLRTTWSGGDYRLQLLVGNRDATGRRQLIDTHDSFASSLDWTPDGRLLITYARTVGKDSKGHDRYQTRLLTMDADGGSRKVLVNGPTGGFLVTPWLYAQAISPDGTSLLYTRANMKQTQLRSRDLESGKDRLITYGAMEASYSPDGGTIVFSAEECLGEEQECDSGKWLKPGLWTVGTDGTGLTHLFDSKAGAMSPSYSPDGTRVIFSSGRNSPDLEEGSHEIYSISSDGGCLTWLTNGSPASVSPSWGPEADANYSPGGCGANGRQPLVEIRPPKRRKTDPTPRLWAGPRVGSRLLSSLTSYWPGSRSEIYAYSDCAYFNPNRCSEPLTLETVRRCQAFDEIDDFGKPAGFMRRRGALVIKTTRRGRTGATAVATGRAILAIGESVLHSGRGKPNTFADHLEMISLLRPVGKPWVPGSKLPARVRKPACR